MYFCGMTIADTLEIRWFGEGAIPERVLEWFRALGPEPPLEKRSDLYLMPRSHYGKGVKLRESMLEVKQLQIWREVDLEPGPARLEAWRKWSFPTDTDVMPEKGWIEVRKERQQVPITKPVPAALEVAEVRANGMPWWSVCLEAKEMANSREEERRFLQPHIDRWFHNLVLPNDAWSGGYPAWLARLRHQGQGVRG